MPKESHRLYLIDGSSYVYRAFHALPPLSTPEGVPSQAVYGFTTMLLKLLGDIQPEYLAVVFDAPGKTFRDELYGEYKANRPAAPDDLRVQIPLIHDIVDAFGICKIAEPGVEADDVIATLVERYASERSPCVVVTGDKDLMQLVGEHVILWDTMRDRWIDAAAVKEKFGVTPDRVADVMALMGDAVDNVPGVAGIGPKTATALIAHFGSLDALLERVEEVQQLKSLRGAKRVAQRLADHTGDARLSRELVLVRRDIALDVALEDCSVPPPDAQRLQSLFEELGFQSLLRQLTAACPPSSVESESVAEVGELDESMRRCLGEEPVEIGLAVVEEEADHGPRAAELVVGCGERALRIPLAESAMRGALGSRLSALVGDRRIVAHDWKRCWRALAALGITLDVSDLHCFDLMVASYLLDPAGAHDFERLASSLAGVSVPGFRDDAPAACAGVLQMQTMAEKLENQLRAADLLELFDRVEMPLVEVLARVEERGISLDVGRLQAIGKELRARLSVLMNEIHQLAGIEFNINSAPQLRDVLFERLRLPTKGVKKGKTGFSTDVDVLTRLAKLHELPEKILAYRGLSKLMSTYVDALPASVRPSTGRLHTTLHQTVAATGRLSSSDPNLQNIPIRGEDGKRIREAFVAPPGRVLLAADYSQIELRVLAHLSADPGLIDAFRSGEDIHARTAAEIFDAMPATVTGDMRRTAKVINFGILYGMGPQRLAHELGIPMREAQQTIASYFERYPSVRDFMRSIVETGRETGYVRTLLGRRRPVPELRSRQRGVAQAAERAAANTPIQGSAADLIKLAMLAVDRRLRSADLDAAMVLQVHDELLVEADQGQCDEVCAVLKEEMEGVMQLAVPLQVDVGVGRSWAEAH